LASLYDYPPYATVFQKLDPVVQETPVSGAAISEEQMSVLQQGSPIRVYQVKIKNKNYLLFMIILKLKKASF